MRQVLAVAALAVLLAVSGCVPKDVIPTLPPTPTATPVFASEEEALAAAEEAYAAYLEMSDLIASEGGVDPERIAPFVSEDQLPNELASFEQYRENGWHASGPVGFDSATLQSLIQDDVSTEVILYVCLDATEARLIDIEGKDVTPIGRPDRLPFEVGFVWSPSESLVVSRSEPWAGQDFC